MTNIGAVISKKNVAPWALAAAACCLLSCGSPLARNARRATAKNDVIQIANAIKYFHVEYGQLPLVTPGAEMQSNRDLVAVLGPPTGAAPTLNPRGIIYFEARTASLRGGTLVDPWGNPYRIALDHDSDSQINPGGHLVLVEYGIWSAGPNGIDDHGGGDDIRSWP